MFGPKVGVVGGAGHHPTPDAGKLVAGLALFYWKALAVCRSFSFHLTANGTHLKHCSVTVDRNDMAAFGDDSFPLASPFRAAHVPPEAFHVVEPAPFAWWAGIDVDAPIDELPVPLLEFTLRELCPFGLDWSYRVSFPVTIE